ncbi:MAG: hypothetical protein ACLP8S_18985 [Solirubrobacteraceae bacterium]
MTAWWIGLSDAQATVTCSDQQHRLRWSDGRLKALDHGDPEDERALAALGGQPCTCIELLDAWERHRDDLRVLVLGTRGPTDLIRIDRDLLSQQHGSRHRGRPAMPAAVPRAMSRPAGMMIVGGTSSRLMSSGGAPGRGSKRAAGEAELLRLLALGGGIPDRLLATVAATWSRRIQSGASATRVKTPELHAALQGRAFVALRAWLGEPNLAAALTMINAADQPALARQDGSVHAALPFNWLAEVWAKGLTTVCGRFCLAADTDDGRHWRLTTIAPALDKTEPLTITLNAP